MINSHTLAGKAPLDADTALLVLHATQNELPAVMAAASQIRQRHFGNTVHLCSIINAKSGACTEDCAFCAQSAHHDAHANVFDLKQSSEIVGARDVAAKLPIGHFGVVTSGARLKEAEVSALTTTLAQAPHSTAQWCASLGALTENQLLSLKKAGLKRFHHNLETAESFFPNICSTHTYAERLETVRAAKRVGLEVCSGCLLGMGESPKQRVELATALAAEHVDAIPLNFLVPIKGTPLASIEPMQAGDILKTIAMFRLTCPAAEIKVCAGRTHLRDLQPGIFEAGATGMMIGPLLTVAGGDVQEDLDMLKDLKLKPLVETHGDANDLD